MIWIDFGVICIGQEKVSMPSDMNDVVIEGYRRIENSKPFYDKSYNFNAADKLLGCWYKIWLSESLCYEESFFDIASKGIPCVKVVPKWSNHVKNILSFYLKQSPINKIAVLLRIEDASDDVVHSSCSFNEFVQRLNEGNIKWNELYHVYL